MNVSIKKKDSTLKEQFINGINDNDIMTEITRELKLKSLMKKQVSRY